MYANVKNHSGEGGAGKIIDENGFMLSGGALRGFGCDGGSGATCGVKGRTDKGGGEDKLIGEQGPPQYGT